MGPRRWAVGARERQVRPEVERESTCVRQTPSLPSLPFSSTAQPCPTLRPHEPQRARPPCPSPAPGHYSDSCPSSRRCHPASSSSALPSSSCPHPSRPIRVFSNESALLALREPKSEDAQASAKGGKKMYALDAHTRQHVHRTCALIHTHHTHPA